MAHPLPTTTLDQCNGAVYCLFKWLDTVTNGFAMSGMLFSFQIVLFMASSNRFGTTRAFGFAAIVGLLGATFLATAKLMPWWFASIFILVGAVGFAALILNER